MKKQILIIFCSIFSLTGFTQIVSLANPINVMYGTASNTGEILEPSWDVTNISGATMDIGARMIIDQNVAGTTHQLCWGEICSGYETGNIISGETVTLADGESSSTFYAKYLHAGHAGQAIIRFCWFEAGNMSNAVCHTVNFCVDGTCILAGVEEKAPTAKIEMITPNPIQTIGFINYSFSSNPHAGKMTIYNSLGAQVKQVALTSKNGTLIVGSDELENGVYFCTIEEDGHVYQTQRLMINK